MKMKKKSPTHHLQALIGELTFLDKATQHIGKTKTLRVRGKKSVGTRGKKPKCIRCPACEAPAIESPKPRYRLGRCVAHSEAGCKVCEKRSKSNIEHVNLLEPLKDLVRCLRNFELGDYSPLMDEIFDAESAIALAEKKPRNGIEY